MYQFLSWLLFFKKTNKTWKNKDWIGNSSKTLEKTLLHNSLPSKSQNHSFCNADLIQKTPAAAVSRFGSRPQKTKRKETRCFFEKNCWVTPTITTGCNTRPHSVFVHVYRILIMDSFALLGFETLEHKNLIDWAVPKCWFTADSDGYGLGSLHLKAWMNESKLCTPLKFPVFWFPTPPNWLTTLPGLSFPNGWSRR